MPTQYEYDVERVRRYNEVIDKLTSDVATYRSAIQAVCSHYEVNTNESTSKYIERIGQVGTLHNVVDNMIIIALKPLGDLKINYSKVKGRPADKQTKFRIVNGQIIEYKKQTVITDHSRFLYFLRRYSKDILSAIEPDEKQADYAKFFGYLAINEDKFFNKNYKTLDVTVPIKPRFIYYPNNFHTNLYKKYITSIRKFGLSQYIYLIDNKQNMDDTSISNTLVEQLSPEIDELMLKIEESENDKKVTVIELEKHINKYLYKWLTIEAI